MPPAAREVYIDQKEKKKGKKQNKTKRNETKQEHQEIDSSINMH